jgi:RNA-directed DNA polymerase
MTAATAVAGPPCGDAPDWHAIDWQRCRRDVRRLQARLVQAVKEQRWRTVRSLQRLLVRSTAAKALAVRRVTDNRGKRTPGVDGIVWRSPGAKANAIGALGRRGYRTLPLRRLYIPKPGGKKKRPLGIPTMRDRAMQALHLMALDPVAETLLEPHACGFRPERSCADAISHCFNILSQRGSARWVLEGDIRSCFDKISHQWLVAHVPMDKGILRQWLESGYMEGQTLTFSREGTPQGGVISPTLMNLTLNGLEAALRERFPGHRRQARKHQVYLVSYADDFVITGASEMLLVHEVKPIVARFLAERGLALSTTKTQVTSIEVGFDFLGQNIRKYDNGKLLIMPSRKSQTAFRTKVKSLIRRLRTAPQAVLIRALNPVIRGWANYHRHVVSKRVFSHMDNWLWRKLWRWASRRHPRKSRRWIKRRYFHSVGLRNWVFRSVGTGATGQRVEHTLLAMADTPIRRHRRA